MSSSAVARLVASGILCSSQIRKILFTSGSCGLGFNGSRRKMTRSMSLCSICAPSCWMPPKCPARYLCTERFATSSIRRPVVPVAYKLFLLQIPLYAMQKFCISFFFESCATNPMFIANLPMNISSAVIQHSGQFPFPCTVKQVT